MDISIEYVTRDYVRRQSVNSFLGDLIKKLLKGKIVVLEGVLNPSIQAKLLLEILRYVDTYFFGIDFKTVDGIRSKRKLTIIYPKVKDRELKIEGTSEHLCLSITTS